jgi:hypothetical protein
MSQKFFASVLLLFSLFVLRCHSERSEEPLYFVVVVVACFSVVYRKWVDRDLPNYVENLRDRTNGPP